MFLFTLLVASCYGDEKAVGFGQEQNRIECWMGHCNKIDNPDSGHTNSGGGVFGGGEVEHVGMCLVSECMEYFNVPRSVCEDKDGWNCAPFTTATKKCDPADGCEVEASNWVGDGVCDFKKCGNCYGFWHQNVFDGGDCTASQMTESAAEPEGYRTVKSGVICDGGFYLKGLKWTTKAQCEKNCDDRSGCDTFCWSDRSPHWDCLMYTGCSKTTSRFTDGSSTATYTCLQKPGAEAGEMMSNVVAQAGTTVDSLLVDFFAVIGVLLMAFYLVRRLFVTSKPTDRQTAPVATEITPLETTTTKQ